MNRSATEIRWSTPHEYRNVVREVRTTCENVGLLGGVNPD
ncbi:glycine cleavage system aminomethyltransferase T [Paraburkholderia sp. GAS448]